MTSKVDNVLHLSNDRKTVRVTGPISDWQNDEAAAVFSVVISQASGNGAGPTTAIGASTITYVPDEGTWVAEATVTRNNMQFHEGNATAHAWATIAQPGGDAESYEWTVPTTLSKNGA
jgi:hypothetical protein